MVGLKKTFTRKFPWFFSAVAEPNLHYLVPRFSLSFFLFFAPLRRFHLALCFVSFFFSFPFAHVKKAFASRRSELAFLLSNDFSSSVCRPAAPVVGSIQLARESGAANEVPDDVDEGGSLWMWRVKGTQKGCCVNFDVPFAVDPGFLLFQPKPPRAKRSSVLPFFFPIFFSTTLLFNYPLFCSLLIFKCFSRFSFSFSFCRRQCRRYGHSVAHFVEGG